MDEKDKLEVFESLTRQTNKVFFCYHVETDEITFLNNAFNRMWGRTKESVMANPALILDSIHPDDKEYILQEYSQLLHGIIKHNVEFRILKPDRTTRWLILDPYLVFLGKGRTYIAGLVDDITSVKNNISNLEKFGAKKNSVLEILSHDLAGPLANIQSLTDILSETTAEYANAELDNVIRIIRESSARSVRLIRDFVQQEFLESSNTDMVKRRVDLVKRIQDIIEQYKEGKNHIKKDIRFTSSTDKFYVYIDENKFMQVINNLFSNAIKFTPENGIIGIDLVEQEDSVLITVKDNGIGIPKRYHDELFDKFTRARREGLRGEPSTGLGMSIIKTIIEWHNGKIWFESEENKGTTFYIEIPKI
ncbi:PAS domain-containing sensor histidine kinase [Pontibacter korlensis]|uniref:histidine kinase n=1 Tax=Pontibacter korlensis TaxID=400092 RepID=A0A0E3UXX6_9BACT|nr:PAS domain-containing sensor histidine kinase [Pontibacter korlensis]AKD04622.1 phosphate regulon sensor protein PhoR [Pontibacter korlensis]